MENLVVVRAGRRILDEISFDVSPGEIVGLLGPNGAGKTTTLAVLATLIKPQAGHVRIAGHDLRRNTQALRKAIGRVPQEIAVYPTLTARENVALFARLIGLRGQAARHAVDDALEQVGLTSRAGDRAATYSGGMLRRLSLACGMLGSPPTLLLDEPAAGVDPQSRQGIVDAIRRHAARGAGVLYSTHDMEEAEQVCDRVVLIDHGRVIATGTPAAVIATVASGLYIEVVTGESPDDGWLDALEGVRRIEFIDDQSAATAPGNVIRIAADSFEVVPPILERARTEGIGVREFHLRRPSLREAFLTLTGRALRD